MSEARLLDGEAETTGLGLALGRALAARLAERPAWVVFLEGPLGAGKTTLARGVLRGVDSRAFLVHPQVRIVEGRPPEPARDEIMVGSLVASKLGLDDDALPVGAQLWIDGRPFTISGRFEAPQTVMDAEIWCPLTDLQVIAQRDSLSCAMT